MSERTTSELRPAPSYITACRHEIESVQIMNFDAHAFLISSRALIIAQISAVKIDAVSGNLM